MSFRWSRAAVWALLAACLCAACIPALPVGGSRSRSRMKIPSSKVHQGLHVIAGLFLIGPDLVFRRSGVDGKVAVRGGWPVVVVYELEQPGFLRLTVTAKNGAATSYRLPEAGMAPSGSLQENILHLSKDLGDAIQEGSLSLRAYAGEAGDRPVPFKTYGLGAGEQAVGSMTIVNVLFSPPEISVGRHQGADFSFKVRRSFSKVQVQINHLDDSTGVPTPVFRWVLHPTPSQDQEPEYSWNGRDDKKHRISEGLHTLQVSAWFGPDVGAWNAALSGTLVRVRP
jgi:hypothetical protein